MNKTKKPVTKKLIGALSPSHEYAELVGVQEFYWCHRGLRRGSTVHLVPLQQGRLVDQALCGHKHPRLLWIYEYKKLQAKPTHNCQHCTRQLERLRSRTYAKKVVKPCGG